MLNLLHYLSFALMILIIPGVLPAQNEEPIIVKLDDNPVSGTAKQCLFFGENRYSQAESSLTNCSWYKSNSCCKRTEVTSVFSGMMKLKGASRQCSNLMHYMMCYFCSPFQSVWYRRRVMVCAQFCNSLFKECKKATYNGRALGSVYKSGRDFCEVGQNFLVVDRDYACFNFDPTVFSSAPAPDLNYTYLLIISTLYYYFS